MVGIAIATAPADDDTVMILGKLNGAQHHRV